SEHHRLTQRGERVLALVVGGTPKDPACAAIGRGRVFDDAVCGRGRSRLAGHGGDNEVFEAFLGRVGGWGSHQARISTTPDPSFSLTMARESARANQSRSVTRRVFPMRTHRTAGPSSPAPRRTAKSSSFVTMTAPIDTA